MAPKHTTGGPRAHYPGINKVAPAHAIGGSHRSEYSCRAMIDMGIAVAEVSRRYGVARHTLYNALKGLFRVECGVRRRVLG